MKFLECEKWLRHYMDAGQPIGNVEFNDVEDIQIPSRLPRNSMAWPVGWLPEEKRYWRAMMEMDGSPFMPADEVEGPNYWVMDRWMRRYREGKSRRYKRAYRRQVLRWLVGMTS